MTLPRSPVGPTAVENRIEDGGRKCSGSRSGMVRRRRVYSAQHGRPGSASRSCCNSGHVSGQGVLPPCRRRHRSRLCHDPLQGHSLRSRSKVRTRTWRDSGAGISKAGTGRGAAIPDSHDGEFRGCVKNGAGSSGHDVRIIDKLGSSTQHYARAFALSWSNSAWVIVPASRSCLADAI